MTQKIPVVSSIPYKLSIHARVQKKDLASFSCHRLLPNSWKERKTPNIDSILEDGTNTGRQENGQNPDEIAVTGAAPGKGQHTRSKQRLASTLILQAVPLLSHTLLQVALPLAPSFYLTSGFSPLQGIRAGPRSRLNLFNAQRH